MKNKKIPVEKNKKIIYSTLNYDDEEVYETYNLLKKDKSKRMSKNSFSFINYKEYENEPEKIGKAVTDFFKTKFNIDVDDEVIKKKISSITEGEGHEIYKIARLNSSSLCAFLHFYDVSNYPIEIDNVKYNQVYFEIQNEVFDMPSCMDLVLKSIDGKKLLFLEAKFSEYFDRHKYRYDIGKKYEGIYKKIIKNDFICDSYKNKKGNDVIKLGSIDLNAHYMEGIKQIISHYIGICNFIKDGKSYKSDDNNNEIIELENCKEIELATIIFDGWKDEKLYKKNFEKEYKKLYKKYGKYLKDYSDLYSKIAKNINEYIINNQKIDKKIEKLHVRENILTYQEEFKKGTSNYDTLKKEVKNFYYGDKN